MNEMMVKGIVEMGASASSCNLYEDYYKHRPVLGKTKLKGYTVEFAEANNKK